MADTFNASLSDLNQYRARSPFFEADTIRPWLSRLGFAEYRTSNRVERALGMPVLFTERGDKLKILALPGNVKVQFGSFKDRKAVDGKVDKLGQF